MLGYDNSLEHLLEELRRIDLLIRLQILQFRMLGRGALDEFKGLYIEEDELDTILAEVGSGGVRPEIDRAQLTPLLDCLTALEAQIATRKAASRREGTVLCLERLQAVFSLSPFDLDVLLICLAPELDLRYEKLYAYLQDDVTKKRPSVDLVLHLLCPSFEARLAVRRRFTPGCPLFKHSLLYLCDDPSQNQPPLLSKYLKVDERVVHYLLGSDELDVRLLPYAQRLLPQSQLEDLLIPTDVKYRLTLLTREIKGEGLIFYFHGPYGTGKQTVAEALCRELGLGLLVVDGARLLNAREVAFDLVVRLAMREALLRGAALYWQGFEALLADDKRVWLEALLRELENRQGLTFLAGDTAWEPADALQALPFVRLEFPHPTYPERLQLWAAALQGEALCGADLDLRALANKFRFSTGQIRDAASTARNLARWRDPQHGHVTMADLAGACRLQSNRKLGTLAHKITPHYTWDDIILPADRLQQLREICNAVKYRARVYDDWGFGPKLSLGKGLNVLFAGPSGTGKTMAAEIIAGELGLDLYKIDLSTVVSK